MDDYSKLLQLVDDLYATVLDEDALPSTLTSLANFADARSAFYLTADAQTGAILSAESVNIDPFVQEQYVRHWSQKDVLVPPALSVPVGDLMTEHSLAPRGEFENSEIYHDLYHLHDIPHLLVSWIQKTPRTLTAVSVQRSLTQGRFLRRDEERYKAVVPHVVRALRLRRELHAARRQAASTLGVIDRLPFGVVFLDDSGRVVEVSAAAAALLSGGNGVFWRNGSIRAALPDDDRRLQRAIQQTLLAKATRLMPGDTVTVRRRDGKRSLTVAVVPIRSECHFVPVPPACMLVIFDPDNSPQPATATIKQRLGLTGAEARLASALVTGITLREAAEQLQLSLNTCKSQLKSIYAKTGCKSHVDLAKSVLFAVSTAHAPRDA